MTFEECMKFISSYSRLGKKVTDLSRARELMERVGDPQNDLKFIHIAGNCDHNSRSPAELVIPVENHRIFAAHGHRYNVKFSLDLIKNAASEKNCDIILYGHTHVRMNLYSDGTYIMNPGSASCPNDGTKPSFGVIEICDAGVSANIADI